MPQQPVGGEGSEDGPFCLKQGVIVIALIVGAAAVVLYLIFGRNLG